MNVRARKPAQPVRRRPGIALGNREIAAAAQDPDVAQMAATQIETRVADHQVQVALAAYFIAQKRGFEPGHELDDWLAAEAQIAAAEQPSLSKPIQALPTESIS